MLFTFSWIRLLLGSKLVGDSLSQEVVEAPVALVLMVYAVLVFMGIAWLTSYHCWLISRNVTTHEHASIYRIFPFINYYLIDSSRS